MDDVAAVIEEGRAANYEKEKFLSLFESFDEDNNGFLSKGEMATLIKRTFRNKSN